MLEIQSVDSVEADLESAEELTVIPTYIPTIEETFTASGGHRQFM
ncbi:hypothetical protein [Sinomonas susongensis]|nr:hypothetical protein [Sinomonas susongensis]